MATLFEKIAAKKALEAAAQAKTVEPIAQNPETVVQVATIMAAQKVEAPIVEASVSEGKPIVLSGQEVTEKPLSFAEKMALRKLETQKTSTSSVSDATAQTAKTTEQTSIKATQEKEGIPEAVVIGIVSHVAEEEDHEAEVGAATPEDQQAYYDIKAKINMLSDMSESNLPGAMKELKAALLKNPQACYLILPQDIGQMVIALRAMKNEAVVDATKTPKEKKAKASKALTADEIALAFDEL